jgi:hypothetical protein
MQRAARSQVAVTSTVMTAFWARYQLLLAAGAQLAATHERFVL